MLTIACKPLQIFNRFEEVFEQFKRRVLLLGAPGSGKTTTLLHVAQLLIRQAQHDPDAPIPLLRDRHDSVRSSAARALGQIGDRTAVPDLLTALRDRHERVRDNVKEALKKIGTPEALNALKQNADQETPDDQQPD